MNMAAGFGLFINALRKMFTSRRFSSSAKILSLTLILIALMGIFAPISAQDGFDDDFEFVDIPDYGFSGGGDDEFEFIDLPDYGFGSDESAGANAEPGEELIADEESFDPNVIPEPDVLLKVADDRYFPREGYSQNFSETQGYVNEVLEDNIIHQYYVRSGMGSDMLMSMFPAERSMRTGNLRLDMKRGLEKDYHASFSMLRSEDVPSGSGGCWLRYTNVQVKGEGSESGLILLPGQAAFAITPLGNLKDLNYTYVSDLSTLDPRNMIKFDFIRLNGVSYIYANGNFLFSYDDGYNGRMSFEGGAELYEGGNRVRCDFDNFTMRYR